MRCDWRIIKEKIGDNDVYLVHISRYTFQVSRIQQICWPNLYPDPRTSYILRSYLTKYLIRTNGLVGHCECQFGENIEIWHQYWESWKLPKRPVHTSIQIVGQPTKMARNNKWARRRCRIGVYRIECQWGTHSCPGQYMRVQGSYMHVCIEYSLIL